MHLHIVSYNHYGCLWGKHSQGLFTQKTYCVITIFSAQHKHIFFPSDDVSWFLSTDQQQFFCSAVAEPPALCAVSGLCACYVSDCQVCVSSLARKLSASGEQCLWHLPFLTSSKKQCLLNNANEHMQSLCPYITCHIKLKFQCKSSINSIHPRNGITQAHRYISNCSKASLFTKANFWIASHCCSTSHCPKYFQL